MISISVITVVLNAADKIEATICNVIQQRYKALEYIVIDGGSTDGTVSIIEKYKQSGDIDYFICGKDDGIYDAMNKGLMAATGDLIGFINAGDLYEQGVLDDINEKYDGKSDVIYGKTIHQMPDGSNRYSECKELIDIVKCMIFCHNSAFVSRKSLDKYGFFFFFYKIAGDYDWFLRCYFGGGSFQYVDEYVASFDWGGISTVMAGKSLMEKIHCKLPYIKQEGIKDGIQKDFENLPIELLSEKLVTEPERVAEVIKAVLGKSEAFVLYGYGVMGHLIEKLCAKYGIGIEFISDAGIERDGILSEAGYELYSAKKIGSYFGKVIISIKKDGSVEELRLPEAEGREYITFRDLGNNMLKHDNKYLHFIDEIRKIMK